MSFKKNIFIVILVVFTMGLAISYFINLEKINQNGVYVLGQVTEVSEYKSGSSMYKYEYYFRHTKYQSQMSGGFLGRAGSLFFVKLIPDSPLNHTVLEFNHVPNKLTLDSVPENGWKILPQ